MVKHLPMSVSWGLFTYWLSIFGHVSLAVETGAISNKKVDIKVLKFYRCAKVIATGRILH